MKIAILSRNRHLYSTKRLVEACLARGHDVRVINYAKCCYPIPGDHIVGIFNSGRGIVIHREHCNNAIEMQRYPEKYIFVAWADNVTGLFSVELKIEARNHKGIIAEIARILSDCDANIENIQINEEVQCAILFFKIQINNINHLNPIPGICSGCKKGCSGYTFLDEVDGFYVDIVFEANKEGNIDFTECVNLKNEIVLTNKKEQIFMNEKGFEIAINDCPF